MAQWYIVCTGIPVTNPEFDSWAETNLSHPPSACVSLPSISNYTSTTVLYITQYGSTVYIGMALVWPAL